MSFESEQISIFKKNIYNESFQKEFGVYIKPTTQIYNNIYIENDEYDILIDGENVRTILGIPLTHNEYWNVEIESRSLNRNNAHEKFSENMLLSFINHKTNFKHKKIYSIFSNSEYSKKTNQLSINQNINNTCEFLTKRIENCNIDTLKKIYNLNISPYFKKSILFFLGDELRDLENENIQIHYNTQKNFPLKFISERIMRGDEKEYTNYLLYNDYLEEILNTGKNLKDYIYRELKRIYDRKTANAIKNGIITLLLPDNQKEKINFLSTKNINEIKIINDSI